MPDDEVPEWCGFFGAEEYAEFEAKVDGALCMFGAEDEDIGSGYVELPVGDPVTEIAEFCLESLAVRCRDSPREQWESICARQIIDWVEGGPQRKWLSGASFDVVEDHLEVWLTSMPAVIFEGDPGGDDQPFSAPIADELYVSLAMRVPELDDTPAAWALVPNSAVSAWSRTADQLLESARQRLRRLPAPVWERQEVPVPSGGTVTTAELYVAKAAPDVSTPVAAWLLILDEVTPVPATLVAVPDRSQIVMIQYDRDQKIRLPRVHALIRHARLAYHAAGDDTRLSLAKYRYRPPRSFQLLSGGQADVPAG